MTDRKTTQTEIMIRLDEKMLEVLRRIDSFDKVIVPRSEFTIVVDELRAKHSANQSVTDNFNANDTVRLTTFQDSSGTNALRIPSNFSGHLIGRTD